MKRTTTQKGITLIALIITIVVLLILAVVTIGAVKDSKIITHAENASDRYTKAQAQEQIQLALNEWEIQSKYSTNTETFKSSMTSSLLETATVEGENEGPLSITTKSGDKYTIDKNGVTIEGDIGKYVKFDDKLWRIIYNDSTNGLQMISAELLGNLRLGAVNDLVSDWNSLMNVADLNEDGTLATPEKAIYTYNNAITTLNTACENLLKDESENFKSEYITSVRCVGSNPVDKNSENTTLYTSENLAKWPLNNNIYRPGIMNNLIKSADENYKSDLDRIMFLDIGNLGKQYYLASRRIYVTDSNIRFDIYTINGQGSLFGYFQCFISETALSGNTGNALVALRPVVTLRADIQFSGSGTEADPYTF